VSFPIELNLIENGFIAKFDCNVDEIIIPVDIVVMDGTSKLVSSKALIDTGASGSGISFSKAKEINFSLFQSNRTLEGVNGEPQKALVGNNLLIRFPGNQIIVIKEIIGVTEKEGFDLIFGIDMLKIWDFSILRSKHETFVTFKRSNVD